MLIVAAGALIDPTGLILIQRRPAAGADEGLWEFPGGKLEPGETPAAALARELMEELSIGVDEADLRPITFAASRRLVLLLYAVLRWTGEPVALHAEALAWRPAQELSRLPMPALDRPLLAPLIAFLRR